MTAQDRDRPNLVIFPPLVLLAVLVLAIALQWLERAEAAGAGELAAGFLAKARASS